MEERGRVLIVDDNAMNVDIIRLILRKEYDLETAASGEECLGKLAAFKPELVLLDIMMPGIDGYETCRRIKSGSLGHFVQVVLVSGKATIADRVRGYESLADDFVVKPFDHDELLSKVRAHFRLRDMRTDREPADDQDALVEFRGLVHQMLADIKKHSDVIDGIQWELNASGTKNPDTIIEAMVQLANTNQATRGRLALAEQRLRRQAQEIESYTSEARIDSLTLLPNRRAFDETLARQIAEANRVGAPFCIAMIDIDWFKTLNDQYGHMAGDEVLRVLGRTLSRTLRQMDLLARLGGDEFVAIMPASTMEEARKGMTRVCQAVRNSVIHFDGRTLQTTVSIGLAQWLPGEEESPLLKRADLSLYAAKQAGRNGVQGHDGEHSHPIVEGKASPPVAYREAHGGPVTPSLLNL